MRIRRYFASASAEDSAPSLFEGRGMWLWVGCFAAGAVRPCCAAWPCRLHDGSGKQSTAGEDAGVAGVEYSCFIRGSEDATGMAVTAVAMSSCCRFSRTAGGSVLGLLLERRFVMVDVDRGVSLSRPAVQRRSSILLIYQHYLHLHKPRSFFLAKLLYWYRLDKSDFLSLDLIDHCYTCIKPYVTYRFSIE